jgi:dihydroflavonol-4-reductase
MKVFIIGGTGLLGSASAAELIKRGHQVVSIALLPLPDKSCLPSEMEIIPGNFLNMSDDELKGYLAGCDAFVFAAGVDERVEFPAPVLDYYIKYNVDSVKRLLRLSKEAGIKRAVILGSYFSWFAKEWPALNLTRYHPYIKSRILQEEVALSFNDDGMDVMVLELPYIFGTQPGRKPVWTFLVQSIKEMKGFTLYTKGGTTMVTVRQVAQAVSGAIENGKGGTCYPVGWFNMTWKEMLAIFHKYMGMPNRKIITIPTFLFRMNGKKIMKDFEKRGIESGLDIVAFTAIQTSETFIDKTLIQNELGVTDDDIDTAIGESVKLCLIALEGKSEMIEMKAE